MATKKYKMNYKEMNVDDLNVNFCSAALNGDFKLIKHLCTLNFLDKKSISNGLRYACANGHIKIVKFLLTDKSLKQKADIHALNDDSFVAACERGRLDIVKYLTTSQELKEHANIHAQNDSGFKFAINGNHMDIVNFLIFEVKIEKTKKIEKFLLTNKIDLIQVFDIRDLKEKLNKNLIDNTKLVQKMKI